LVYNFRGDLVVARLGLDLQAVAGFIVLAKEVLRLLFEIDEQRDWHFFGFYGIVGLLCVGGTGSRSKQWPTWNGRAKKDPPSKTPHPQILVSLGFDSFILSFISFDQHVPLFTLHVSWESTLPFPLTQIEFIFQNKKNTYTILPSLHVSTSFPFLPFLPLPSFPLLPFLQPFPVGSNLW
jgi:hypothetical protein